MEKRVEREGAEKPTGILQGISMLLEFDTRVCAIAEQRRIAGIALYCFGIQPRGSRKVVGYSDKVWKLAEQKNAITVDLPSIHEKAWFASALSFAASCLSSSVISLGSAKLRLDSSGDGMTDEGGVVEEKEGEDDSLMLTINTPPSLRCLSYSIRCYLYSVQIRSGQTQNLLHLP